MPTPTTCARCRNAKPLAFDFTMAFQPIMDVRAERVWGYEALVRGVDGASAASVLELVACDDVYTFDQACRVKAIELAGARMPNDGSRLSINFRPRAVYEPRACIRASLDAAARSGFDPKRLMFEFTEDEKIENVAHVERIVQEYRSMGFTTAIDDFGAGYAGLNLLTKFKPQILKLDMELCQGIAGDIVKRTITEGAIKTAQALGIKVIAEGVETKEDMVALRTLGTDYFQGYLFGKPVIETLPEPDFSAV